MDGRDGVRERRGEHLDSDAGEIRGVIDFDRLMSGGPVYEGSQSLRPEFACDDDAHPNAAGYTAMGEFVDLPLFGP